MVEVVDSNQSVTVTMAKVVDSNQTVAVTMVKVDSNLSDSHCYHGKGCSQ